MISGSSNETMRSLAEEETTLTRSSSSDDSDAPEDECETPPEVWTALPKTNGPKVPQENEKYFEKKNYVRTDKYDLGLLHKLMPGLPPIAQLFGDIK
jgi:hypothetical protein